MTYLDLLIQWTKQRKIINNIIIADSGRFAINFI